jgi:hypothetical protein
MKKLPAEIVASALAVTTIFITLLPYHLPPWAIFITWAGTFAAGGPTKEVLRKIWPAMFVGNIFAFVIVLCFRFAAAQLAGPALIAAECVILFVLNATMMSLGRLPLFSFIPGMFFGFASYFATYFGGFGPVPKDPAFALLAVMAMNGLGPIYAWLTARFGEHHHAHHEEVQPHQMAHAKAT